MHRHRYSPLLQRFKASSGREPLFEDSAQLVITQLNEVVDKLQHANAERTLLKQRIAETENVFYNSKKDFWQLTSAARNNKKRRVRYVRGT